MIIIIIIVIIILILIIIKQTQQTLEPLEQRVMPEQARFGRPPRTKPNLDIFRVGCIFGQGVSGMRVRKEF
jgi:hypothetical protein